MAPQLHPFFEDQVLSAEIITDMPEEEYHASSGYGPDLWITRSQLCCYIESPGGWRLRYKEKHPLAQRAQSSKSMDLGSMLDVLITEGQEAYDSHYVQPASYDPPPGIITPSGAVSKAKASIELIEKACAEGIIWTGVPATLKAAQERLPAGVVFRNEAMHELVEFLRDQIMGHAFAHQIVSRSSGKQTTIRMILRNGLQIQVRMDLWCQVYGMAADLKTTAKHPGQFLRACEDYGYAEQAWLYSQACLAAGLPLTKPFLFLVQQTQFPFETDVKELPEDYVSFAGARIIKAITDIADGYSPPMAIAPTIPHMPLWLLHKIDGDA